jgi:hypothetical protein
MPGNHLVFDAFSIEEVTPEHYDPTIYSYRYQNGIRAESISGFTDIKRRLEHLLIEKPYTTEQLARELSFDRQLLQKILDYLFTHTGEVAALDIPQQPTLYIWADREVAENIKTKLTLGAIGVDTDDYTLEDLTAVASYLTNLLVINPSIELLDDAIDKCRLMLDAAKLAQAFQPNVDLENRISLLKKKYDQLCERRNRETERWAVEESDEELVLPDPDVDALPDIAQTRKLYPYQTLYLLGSGQNYTGPDMLKHMSIDDPELTTLSFANLSLLVIELDTFVEDLESGSSVLGLVETYLGAVFPSKGLTVKFRKLPGMKYKRNVENLMHEEILRIRKRGYHVGT